MRNMKNRCPIDFADLADYHEGRADDALARRVREHLSGGCAACEAQLAWLGRALGALHVSGEIAHAPAPALERARALFRTRYPVPERPSLLARLVFDSRSVAAPAFARGEDETSVHLLFSTEALDIDLWQERQSDRSWYLIGQVLPRDEGEGTLAPRSAVLTGASGEIAAVPEAGEFHLPAVAPGRYALRLDLPEGDVLLPDIVVGR